MFTRHLRRELDGQGSQPGLQGTLGGEIRDMVRVRPGDARIRQRNDRPPRLRQILGQGMDQEKRGYGVHRERVPEIVAAKRLERGPRERAARDDDVVHSAHRPANAVHYGFVRVVLGEIGAHEGEAGARPPRPSSVEERFELRPVSARQDDVVSPADERPGDPRAEAARGRPRRAPFDAGSSDLRVGNPAVQGGE